MYKVLAKGILLTITTISEIHAKVIFINLTKRWLTDRQTDRQYMISVAPDLFIRQDVTKHNKTRQGILSGYGCLNPKHLESQMFPPMLLEKDLSVYFSSAPQLIGMCGATCQVPSMAPSESPLSVNAQTRGISLLLQVKHFSIFFKNPQKQQQKIHPHRTNSICIQSVLGS